MRQALVAGQLQLAVADGADPGTSDLDRLREARRTQSSQTQRSLALAADHPQAQALFMSCTALPALGLIDRIEARLGKPVISANQALFWAMLDQAGIAATGPGRLFQVRTW